MSTIAIIQARLGSTRLPEKVLLPLGRIPVLGHIIDRARATRGIDDVIVATSTLQRDDPIEHYVQAQGVNCFRGSETDVLGRYYDAARTHGATMIVRLTGDCPFLDPRLIAQVIPMVTGMVSYASNCWPVRTFPDGLDCEVFTWSLLQEAHAKAQTPEEREHVTPWMHAHAMAAACLVSPDDQGAVRWTLDTQEDYEVLCEMMLGLNKIPHEAFPSWQTWLGIWQRRRPQRTWTRRLRA